MRPDTNSIPIRRAVALVVLPLLAGCNASDLFNPGRVCTLEARAGVLVFVKDSATGAFAASGASLVIGNWFFHDSTAFLPPSSQLDALPLSGASERAGTYTITVKKAGYRDWTRSGVTVTAGECHVATVSLTALLQR